GSELHAHAHAVRASEGVVESGAGARVAATGEGRALVEQVVDRAGDLEAAHRTDVQVVRGVHREVDVGLHPVAVHAVAQVAAQFVLVVGAGPGFELLRIAPGVVHLRAADVAGRQAGGQVTHHVGGDEIAR